MALITRSNGERITADWFSSIKTSIEDGGFAPSYIVKDIDYSVLLNEGKIGLDASSNTVTATLPDATLNKGKAIWLKAIDISNTVTIATFGAQTIEGESSRVLNSVNEFVYLVSDGSNWIIFTDSKAEAGANFLVFANTTAFETYVGRSGAIGDKYFDSTVDDIMYYASTGWKRNESELNKSDTSDPTINDDASAGYEVLSLWLNTTSGDLFRCVDSTTGAAVWAAQSASADLIAHAALTVTHGATGAIVGTTNSQDLTNKKLKTGTELWNPDRLDVKQDTKSNLTTYAGTAGNGQLCFATDEKKMYQVVDSALEELGAGGGGAGNSSIYANLNADSDANMSAWASGNNATFLGGGTIAGTIGLDDVTEIAGTKSYKYTQAAGSLNDYFTTAVQSVPKRSRARDNGAGFVYSYNGDDNDIRAIFYDATNSEEIGYVDLKAGSEVQSAMPLGFVKSSCISSRVGFQTKVLNSGKILIVDDINFTDKPYTYANLENSTEWEAYTPVFQGMTPLGVSCFWRRSGSNLQVKADFITASLTASEARLYLPNSLVIDPIVVPARIGAGMNINNLASDTADNFVLADGGDTFFRFGIQYSGRSSHAAVTGNTFNNGESQSFIVDIPIQGWTATSEHIQTSAKAGSQHYTISQGGSSMTNIAGEVEFNLGTATINNNTEFGEFFEAVDDSGNTRTKFVATKQHDLYVSWGAWANATDYRAEIYKNGTLVKEGSTSTGVGISFYVGDTVRMNIGDFVTIGSNNSLRSSTAINKLTLVARPLQAEFTTAVFVPKVMEVDLIDDSSIEAASAQTLSGTGYNTLIVDNVGGDVFGSTSSNQILLGAGVYGFDFPVNIACSTSTTAYAKIRNATDTSDEKFGYGLSGSNNLSAISLKKRIEITKSTAFEIQGKVNAATGYAYRTSGTITQYKQG